MDLINRIATSGWARLAWLALMLVLAACNNGDNSGGGNPGY
jgi:hypothetical protein